MGFNPISRATAQGVFGLLVAFLFLAVPFPSSQLDAQAVSYTSVTKGEFGGAMGMMMQMVPEGMEEIRETTFIKGALMRTDQDETSTIVNMESGEYTFIQHEDQTYYTINMREMGEQFSAAAGDTEWEEDPEASDMEFDVKVTTDRTGRTQRFDGYSAEQVLMTMELIPISQEARESVEQSGTMVVFTELWLSTDFPGFEAMEAARAEFTEGGFSDQGAGGYNAGLQQAFSSDPRMREAFEKNMEEMKDLNGIPVRTVTSMVTVPKDQEFDRDAVLAASDQPLESTSAGDLLGAAASGAAREALGRMGGMFGRGKKEEVTEEPTAGQSIMMRMTAQLEEVRTSGIPDSIFAPPADYTRQESPWMGGGPGHE